MATEKLPWGLKAKGLAPGSMKNISENKLKAFNIGSMNVIKGTTKKEQEDLKKKREEEEAAEAYKAFVESFDDSDKGLNRSWVKGGLVHPEKGEEKSESGMSRLYKPTCKIADKKVSLHSSKPSRTKDEEKPERPNKPTPTPQRLWTPTPVETGSSKKKNLSSAEKRKTNLELFKEELKVIQEERQEKRKVRQELGIVDDTTRKTRFDAPEVVATGVSLGIKPAPTTDDYRLGSYNYDNDTQSTNIYLGNINPKMTEMQLCEIFGKFGPLASVKVMWPRTDEEKARGRNCGFVAYMNRKDGERAMNSLQGKDIMDFEMKLGWGKAVPIPPHPIYIPPALTELTQPPPPSGLPFNAQPLRPKTSRLDRDDKHEDSDKMLANAIVKVVIPTERNLLNIIHRMVEFVVREGPMFEAMIMNRELQNPMFRFLFENQSPAHVYYRWKLFAILQGDSPFRWRTEEFCMFKGGSIWRPPQMNPYSQGMPDELVESKSEPAPIEDVPKKGGLTDGQRDRLEDMLRDLTPERMKIGDCMVWCLDHAESAEEVVECIAESLSILQTPIPKKIARLFLISDILHNCSARVAHASFFRRFFEAKLPEIFKDIHEAYEKIDARLKAEQFKQKVMACFRAWEDWAVYTSDFLINLQNIFLGLVPLKSYDSPQKEEEEDLDGMAIDDVDGIPLDELDGTPFDGEPDGDHANLIKGIVPYGDDLDGEPVVEPKKPEVEKPKPAFVPSKWETVDESKLEKQAMTVSKWDLLDQKRREEEAAARVASSKNEDFEDDDIDGKPLDEDEDEGNLSSADDVHGARQKSDTPSWHVQDDSTADSAETPRNQDVDRTDEDRISSQLRQGLTEAKRAKLREIELKVMKFQDELEAGKRSRKPEMSISEQVDHYRRKQLRKEEEKEKEDEYDQYRDGERSGDRERDRGRGRDRGRDDDRYVRDVDEESGRDDSYHNNRDGGNDRSSRGRHRDQIGSDDERPRDDDRREAQQRSRGEMVRGEMARAGRDSGIDRVIYSEDKRYRDSGSDRLSRDGGTGAGKQYQDSILDQRDLFYSTDNSYGDRYRGDRSQRGDSASPNRGDCSGASSYVDPSSGPSPLVSYARSQSSESPRTFDDDDDENDAHSSHRHKHRHRSSKKSSKSGSPRRTKRSRSRSQNRHKHKKSRRS